jgi:hypothetical protein
MNSPVVDMRDAYQDEDEPYEFDPGWTVPMWVATRASGIFACIYFGVALIAIAAYSVWLAFYA